MTIKLSRRIKAIGITDSLVARLCFDPNCVATEERLSSVLVVNDIADLTADSATGFAAVISTGEASDNERARLGVPLVSMLDSADLKPGYIVGIEPQSHTLRILYRPESLHNTIFATDRCNSNCLMCSQPPKDVDDSRMVDQHLQLIRLISPPPEALGITGGEPTLLGDGLIRVLRELWARLPNTYVHMLTNGRTYCDAGYVSKIAGVGHRKFTSAVPLYSDIAGIHDYVVQARGAFDQTVEGLYNAAEAGLELEIRVVLHKQTVPRLPQLAHFIYRNFPFVGHIALMGLEHMGYVKKNWSALWIDPRDYSDSLREAVALLHRARMNVSIYNLPLCLISRELWGFARQSISDFKNIYLEECDACSVKGRCSGLFLSQERTHSSGIRAIPA